MSGPSELPKTLATRPQWEAAKRWFEGKPAGTVLSAGTALPPDSEAPPLSTAGSCFHCNFILGLKGPYCSTEEVLGEGSFAVVTRAFDERGRQYAVKTPRSIAPISSRHKPAPITDWSDPSPTAYETRETPRSPEGSSLRRLGMLKDTFAPTSKKNDEEILVMEYRGITLSEYLRKNTESKIEESYALAISLIRELRKLHSGEATNDGSKIVHGDIKPTNVLINPKTMKITFVDYGFAKLLSETKPEDSSASIPGTPSRIPKNAKNVPSYCLDTHAAKLLLHFPKTYQRFGATAPIKRGTFTGSSSTYKTEEHIGVFSDDALESNSELATLLYTADGMAREETAAALEARLILLDNDLGLTKNEGCISQLEQSLIHAYEKINHLNKEKRQELLTLMLKYPTYFSKAHQDLEENGTATPENIELILRQAHEATQREARSVTSTIGLGEIHSDLTDAKSRIDTLKKYDFLNQKNRDIANEHPHLLNDALNTLNTLRIDTRDKKTLSIILPFCLNNPENYQESLKLLQAYSSVPDGVWSYAMLDSKFMNFLKNNLKAFTTINQFGLSLSHNLLACIDNNLDNLNIILNNLETLKAFQPPPETRKVLSISILNFALAEADNIKNLKKNTFVINRLIDHHLLNPKIIKDCLGEQSETAQSTLQKLLTATSKENKLTILAAKEVGLLAGPQAIAKQLLMNALDAAKTSTKDSWKLNAIPKLKDLVSKPGNRDPKILYQVIVRAMTSRRIKFRSISSPYTRAYTGSKENLEAARVLLGIPKETRNLIMKAKPAKAKAAFKGTFHTCSHLKATFKITKSFDSIDTTAAAAA